MELSVAMDHALLVAMLREAHARHRADTAYTKLSQERVQMAVAAVDLLQQEVSIHHCKNKIDNLKREWRVWSDSTKQSGFGADNIGRVTGDERVLETYL
jgi:hypothetical protein